MEHDKLNVEREGKGFRRGFFLVVWIHVNSVANCNHCILWKIGYAATIKREGRKGSKALGSEIKLGFTDIVDWH